MKIQKNVPGWSKELETEFIGMIENTPVMKESFQNLAFTAALCSVAKDSHGTTDAMFTIAFMFWANGKHHVSESDHDFPPLPQDVHRKEDKKP